jgi:hypothetical protein
VRRDCVRHVGIIRHHHHLCTGGIELYDLVKLLRRYANGVENVGDAVSRKIFCLSQRGDGNTAWLALECKASNVDGLRGFHMGPKREVVTADSLCHAGYVAPQNGSLQHKARRREIGQLHAGGDQFACPSIGITGRGM